MKQYTQSEFFNKNCFDFIRYYAAFAVMLLHFTGYFYLTAVSPTQPELQAAHILHKVPVTAPPVVIFFCLSGFLAMASLSRAQSPIDYLKKRIFRLYPAIWLCTVINLIAVIILSEKAINVKQLIIWLITQVFGIANTPDFFKSIATGSVNGPLWTIGVQIQFYIIFSLSYKYISKLKAIGWSIIFAVSLMANIVCLVITTNVGADGVIGKLIERSFVPYLFFAIIGAFVYRYFEHVVPVLTKIWPVFLAAIIVISHKNLPDYGYYSGIITVICTSLFFLGIGYLFKLRLKYDISYELFLYHWIVLNFIVFFDLYNKLSLGLCMALFFGASILLAIISHTLLNAILAVWSKK